MPFDKLRGQQINTNFEGDVYCHTCGVILWIMLSTNNKEKIGPRIYTNLHESFWKYKASCQWHDNGKLSKLNNLEINGINLLVYNSC